ncbi:MAG: DUF3656 domain-containing protein, partial [Planctomyces sp.]
LHASTQMTITSAECLNEIRDLGISRVVLARELSLDEIRMIRSRSDIEIEVFVHGALCVAYSGQCLTSEALGGRSANRGQCAQACRLPWELVCDDELRDLGDQKYLLSPQDLAAYSLTQELIDAGVSSFKIEGRLKTPEYVANITRHYREAIDAAMAGKPVKFTQRQQKQMEQSFSRGFSPGWLQGCDHKMLVPGLSSSKRGVLLGTVTAVHRDSVSVDLEYSVAAGDGIVFDGDRISGTEQGGRVYEVFRREILQKTPVESGIVELSFDRRAIDLSQIVPGQKIWKTDDPRLNEELRRSYQNADPQRKVPLSLFVKAVTGEPLQVRAEAANGASCTVMSEQPLEAARKHAATSELLSSHLNRLGATVYEATMIETEISGSPMIPLSVLGQVRRQMIEQLGASIPSQRRQIATESALPELRSGLLAGFEEKSSRSDISVPSSPVELSVLCRSMSQLRDVVEFVTSDVMHRSSAEHRDSLHYSVIADFQDIREFRDAAEFMANHCGKDHAIPLWLATPRIQKPEEMGIFRLIQKHQTHGVLVRNLSGLGWFREQCIPVIADFSLNVTNELTAGDLLHRGVRRVTASYDLNREQLLDLVREVPPEWLEVVIHQHMPMFHMEHCVFCSVLSPGTNKTNCGRPCDVHKVELRDRTGIDHPLVADVGCRNTLFNAVPQSSSEIVSELLAGGVRSFRVELLRDTTEEIRKILNLYTDLLKGQIPGPRVWKELNAANQVGVTRGRLEAKSSPLPIL